MFRTILFFTFFLITPSIFSQSAENSIDDTSMKLIEEMSKAYALVKEYKTDLHKKEHYKGKLLNEEIIHLNFRKPFELKGVVNATITRRFYFKLSDGFLKVKATLMPFALKFEPYDSTPMKNQHQPATKLGIGALADIFWYYLDGAIKRGGVVIKKPEEVKEDNESLWLINLEYPKFKDGREVVIPKFSNFKELEDKLGMAIPVIINCNKISDYKDLKEGNKIFVPYNYSRRVELFIYKKSGLIRGLKMYDFENRPFEFYIYKELNLNPKFTPEDFEL